MTPLPGASPTKAKADTDDFASARAQFFARMAVVPQVSSTVLSGATSGSALGDGGGDSDDEQDAKTLCNLKMHSKAAGQTVNAAPAREREPAYSVLERLQFLSEFSSKGTMQKLAKTGSAAELASLAGGCSTALPSSSSSSADGSSATSICSSGVSDEVMSATAAFAEDAEAASHSKIRELAARPLLEPILQQWCDIRTIVHAHGTQFSPANPRQSFFDCWAHVLRMRDGEKRV